VRLVSRVTAARWGVTWIARSFVSAEAAIALAGRLAAASRAFEAQPPRTSSTSISSYAACVPTKRMKAICAEYLRATTSRYLLPPMLKTTRSFPTKLAFRHEDGGSLHYRIGQGAVAASANARSAARIFFTTSSHPFAPWRAATQAGSE
jgi:hypothetical protein